MSRHEYRTCDVCDARIDHATHLRLKRFFLHGWLCRLCDWGMTDLNPVSCGWRKNHVDICEGCWDELKDTLRARRREDCARCDECGTGGGGLCPECKDDAEYTTR